MEVRYVTKTKQNENFKAKVTFELVGHVNYIFCLENLSGDVLDVSSGMASRSSMTQDQMQKFVNEKLAEFLNRKNRY
jgi:hypothetical protein